MCRGKENGQIKYYLIDYTFSQFFNLNNFKDIRTDNFFYKLLKDGYVEVDNNKIVKYLKMFNNYIVKFNLDDYFNDIDKKYKK